MAWATSPLSHSSHPLEHLPVSDMGAEASSLQPFGLWGHAECGKRQFCNSSVCRSLARSICLYLTLCNWLVLYTMFINISWIFFYKEMQNIKRKFIIFLTKFLERAVVKLLIYSYRARTCHFTVLLIKVCSASNFI